MLVDLAPHVTLRDLRASFDPKDFTVTGPSAPADIASYTDVSSTPLILAGLIALLGIGVLAHLLITTVRTNRRELAVFKTLGSTRAQLSVMVIWQALMLVGAALVVGLTIGVLAGRGAWTHFADGLGLAPTVDIPVADIALIVGVGLASAALIASLPARSATRTAPARVLREA